MSQEQILKIIKYVIIVWLTMSVIFGIVYIGLAFLVIEMFDQLGEQLGTMAK